MSTGLHDQPQVLEHLSQRLDEPEQPEPARCDLTTGGLCGAPLIRYIPYGQKLDQDYRCSRCGVYVSQFAADSKVGKEWAQFKADRHKMLEQERQKKEEDRLDRLKELIKAKAPIEMPTIPRRIRDLQKQRAEMSDEEWKDQKRLWRKKMKRALRYEKRLALARGR